jgi:hypothetical protein
MLSAPVTEIDLTKNRSPSSDSESGALISGAGFNVGTICGGGGALKSGFSNSCNALPESGSNCPKESLTYSAAAKKRTNEPEKSFARIICENIYDCSITANIFAAEFD